jgi:hypothetical protein
VNIRRSNQLTTPDQFDPSQSHSGTAGLEGPVGFDDLDETKNADRLSSSVCQSRTREFERSSVVDSPVIQTKRLEDSNQTQRESVLWIGIGSLFGAIVLGVVAFIFLLASCTHPTILSAANIPESGNDSIEALVDRLAGLTAADPFFSEQNAVSSSAWIE